MKNMVTKIATIAGVSLVLSATIVGRVGAWGPERTTYTMAEPARAATFNSIIDNVAVGDERDFVRIVEVGLDGAKYSNEVQVQPGRQYEVYIYYHNNASATFNDKAHDYVGVARDVRLGSSFSTVVTPEQKGVVVGEITSSNASPAKVWDEAYMTATEDVTLHYVNGSAKIYNDWDVNGSTLSTDLFSAEGTYLGLNELNGIILGCDEYSGQIVYTIYAQGSENPVDPVNPNEPTPYNPETPEELPVTGPAEAVLAGLIVLALAGGIWYWYKTHKVVKDLTNAQTKK